MERTFGELMESYEPLKHWGQFKDPVYHLCLADTVVAFWSLTQEVACLNPFNAKYFWSPNTANSMKSFRKNPISFFCTNIPTNTLKTKYNHRYMMICWIQY